MTLAELKSDLQDWLRNSEATFVANLNDIISSAERRIYSKAMVPDAKATATVETSDGAFSYEIQANVLRPLRVWLTIGGDDHPPMIAKSAGWLREVSPFSAPGTPTHYAWLRSLADRMQLLVFPKPQGIYTLNMEYMRGDPPSLMTAETWLSTNFPDVLRKVSAHEAAMYLVNQEMMDRYQVLAEAEMASLVGIVGAPVGDEYR